MIHRRRRRSCQDPVAIVATRSPIASDEVCKLRAIQFIRNT
jgi:hypothetical protein